MLVLCWLECSVSRPGHRAHPEGEAWALLMDPVLRSLLLRPTGGPLAAGVSRDSPGFSTESSASPERRRPRPSGRQSPPCALPRVRRPGPRFPDFSSQACPWPRAPGRAPAESWAGSCGAGAQGTATPSPASGASCILRTHRLLAAGRRGCPQAAQSALPLPHQC